ncbi:hypothetical protein [Microvirga sp. VF16]|uniref:hypothetical protein n=1 Tax=Microvirga sp. VF16 TaxID=2807101 RepID=UPI001FEF9A8F|nr:hypothetical protein [Microvirga sp. VF16]
MAPIVLGVKETDTLRIDQDMLAYFQDDTLGSHERINTVIGLSAGKFDNCGPCDSRG